MHRRLCVSAIARLNRTFGVVRQSHKDAYSMDHNVALAGEILDRDRAREQQFVDVVQRDRPLRCLPLLSPKAASIAPNPGLEVLPDAQTCQRVSGFDQFVVVHLWIAAGPSPAQLPCLGRRPPTVKATSRHC